MRLRPQMSPKIATAIGSTIAVTVPNTRTRISIAAARPTSSLILVSGLEILCRAGRRPRPGRRCPRRARRRRRGSPRPPRRRGRRAPWTAARWRRRSCRPRRRGAASSRGSDALDDSSACDSAFERLLDDAVVLGVGELALVDVEDDRARVGQVRRRTSGPSRRSRLRCRSRRPRRSSCTSCRRHGWRSRGRRAVRARRR